MFKIFITVLMLSILTFADAPILQTGQVKSYNEYGGIVTDGSIKDDGYYQKGENRSYSRNGDIVIDNSTGLQWQDNEYARKKWQDGPYWFPAKEYCSNLGLGGYTDWRLPSIQELESLVDASHYEPSVTEDLFTYIPAAFGLPDYWSSEKPNYFDEVPIIDFNDGVQASARKDKDLYVRCVRGEKLEPPQFTRNDINRIVTDNSNGLQWQDDEDAETLQISWRAAIHYCENVLRLGGYTDWRLPNRNELLSTASYHFENSASSDYWSSTTYAKTTSMAWHGSNYRDKTPSYINQRVRCVRDRGPNNLPRVDAGPDKSVQVDESVTISGRGSDSDGVVVSYEWKKGDMILATTPSFLYTPDTVGTDTLTLTVTDNEGGIDTDSMDVKVIPCRLKQGLGICIPGTPESNPGILLPSCDHGRLVQGTDECDYSSTPIDPPGLFLPTCDEGRLVQGTDDCSGSGGNTAPTANDLTINAAGQETVSGTIVINDAEDPVSALTVVVASAPTHGAIVWNSKTDFTYTVTDGTGYNGNDSFTYYAEDSGSLQSATKTVTILSVIDF